MKIAQHFVPFFGTNISKVKEPNFYINKILKKFDNYVNIKFIFLKFQRRIKCDRGD